MHIHKNDNCSQGFFYVYQYSHKNIYKQITATDLRILERKVKKNHLPWRIINEKQANNTIKNNILNMTRIEQDKDSTGFYHVSKNNSKIYGFYYKYYYKESNQLKSLQSRNIRSLKINVEEKGLPWKIINDKKAEQTLLESDKNNLNKESTGYYNVSIMKDSRVNQGFVYRYYYVNKNKSKYISSVDIRKLEKKVKERGLPWYVLNELKVKNLK